MQFFVGDVEICVGRGEDAYCYRIVYHVIAEEADGRRWVHEVRFDSHPHALAFCNQVTKAVGAGRELNFDHWHEMDPAYGSEAYQELAAEGVFVLAEKRQEEEFWAGGPNDISKVS
jgi:hypothetical protein